MDKYIDEIINIFPFEVDFYNQHNMKSHYYGHPLTEGLTTKIKNIEDYVVSEVGIEQVGILPGSRNNEVIKLLPVMLDAISELSKNHLIYTTIAKVAHIDESIYLKIIEESQCDSKNIRIIEDSAYDVMAYSNFLIMSSGTATLEAACFNTPMIVCYKLSYLTSLIVKYVVKIKDICLVNIVAGKRIVPELVHENFTSQNILIEVQNIQQNRNYIVDELKSVHRSLASKDVSKNVALHIVKFLSNSIS